jgi:hypothetical protein
MDNPDSLSSIFTNIFNCHTFGGRETVSGPGSDLEQTGVLIAELPGLFEKLTICSLLDLPCGDFNWMKHVDLRGIEYIGADIVPELTQHNRSLYSSEFVNFTTLNLVEDKLPQVDLILCRDCLVHLCDRDVTKALRNIFSSGAKYLLTTTFPGRGRSWDITAGGWRPINLQAAPFNLPEPLQILNEQCPEAGGAYKDKSLGLWRVKDVLCPLAI